MKLTVIPGEQYDAHVRRWRLWCGFTLSPLALADAFDWWIKIKIDGTHELALTPDEIVKRVLALREIARDITREAGYAE